MPIDDTHPGGIAKFNTNQVIERGDLDAIGHMTEQSLTSMVRAMTSSTYLGSLGGVLTGLEVTGGGGLAVETTVGMALVKDPAADARRPLFRPTILGAFDDREVDAHESQPRIDILWLEPDADNDTNDSRRIYDASSSTQVPTTVQTRQVWSGQVGVTKGTAAASPSLPTLATGLLPLAYIYVPAVSGDADVRPVAQPYVWADSVRLDGGDGVGAYVRSGFAPSLVSGAIEVAGGEAVLKGLRFRGPGLFPHEAQSPTAATSGRIDTIALNTNGLLSVFEGPDDGTGDKPSVSDSFAPVVHGTVNPGTSVYASIEDARVFEPIGTAQLQEGGINVDRLQASSLTAAIGVSVGGTAKTVTITGKTLSGDVLTTAARFLVEVLDGDDLQAHSQFNITGIGTGSDVTGAVSLPSPAALVDSNGSGVAVLTVTSSRSGSNTVLLKATPVSSGGLMGSPVVSFFEISS